MTDDRTGPRSGDPDTPGTPGGGTGDEAHAAYQEAHAAFAAAQAALREAEAARELAVAAHEAHHESDDPLVNAELRRQEAGADEQNPFGRLGRPMSSRSPFRLGFLAALGVGVAYLLYQAILNARAQIVVVVVAAFLAIGLNPIVVRLERVGMRRGWAVLTVFLGLAGFFALVGYALVPPLIEQIADFIDQVPEYLQDLRENETIKRFDEDYGVFDKIEEFLSSSAVGSTAAERVLGAAGALATGFFNALTVLILTLYFLSSFNGIKRTAYRMVPRSRRARASLLGDEILSRVGGYVSGAFIIALIAGTTSLIWLSILGVPYALALALVVAITDVIPLVGATIGAIIVTIVAFFVSIPVGIATAIFYLVYQQVENYLIYPRIMKRSVDVNPAAAIVAVLIGGALLGIVGALLAIPIAAAIQLIMREVVMPRQEAR